MTVELLLGLAGGSILTILCTRARFKRLTVENYRGARVGVVGGIVLAGSLLLGEAAASALTRVNYSETRIGLRVLAGGFFLLGLVDDLYGDRSSKGLRGHLRALQAGTVTTGLVKAVGGLVLAGIVALWWETSFWPAIVAALLIALTANFLNLLDLRPGRASKAFLLLLIPLFVASTSQPFRSVAAILAGATLVWLVADLRERGMLGDSGANLLGGILGAGAVLTLDVPGRILVVLVLAALTLLSERWSFSAAIDKFAPLRWLDRLGRVAS